MIDNTVKLEIPIIVPDIEDDSDECLNFLLESLLNQKGIIKAHIDRTTKPAQLCLHFDSNIITIEAIHRIAIRAGGDFNKRFRHEIIPISRMDTADSALSLMHVLRKLPGMLHTNVNYAAGIVFVAYDSEILKKDRIDGTVQELGFRSSTTLAKNSLTKEDGHEQHDHVNAPHFLPHWMQEWWEIFLIILSGILLLLGWMGESYLEIPSYIPLILFILSYLAGGYDIATHAIPGLFKGQFDTDVLMLSAAIGAALLGEWAEGAFLLFLFGLGHAGEHYALDRARNAVNALGALMPRTAKVKQGDLVREEIVEKISIGDIVIVRPGDRIPVDGKILKGRSAIDQSAITGESVPVEKSKGDDVFAGTINQEASLEVSVSKLAKDNTLSRVMQMVTDAQSQQSPTQQFTQRFTAWFVPAVLIFVLLVVAVPPLLGWMPFQQSIYRGMLLLVAASPCALAVGTPASVLTGIAQGARNGVLIKGGVHLENLGSVKAIAFDKTGTLTQGNFEVTDIVSLNQYSEEDVLSIAAAVEQLSNHPLALAIVKSAEEKGINIPSANGLENFSGRGVRSEVEEKIVLIGSLRLFNEQTSSEIMTEITRIVDVLEGKGKTTMIVRREDEFLGIIALADSPRSGIGNTIILLQQQGIKKLLMLTGDNEKVAAQIGKKVGVTEIHANLLPEDKLQIIKRIQKNNPVAMIGDGINDAPALAIANVGIALGGAGTAVALETADVALMADDLSKLPFAVGLSRFSQKIIRQNLWISLGVIGLLITTSVLGLLQLSWAVVLHEGSTILVVLNALRLLGYRLKEKR